MLYYIPMHLVSFERVVVIIITNFKKVNFSNVSKVLETSSDEYSLLVCGTPAADIDLYGSCNSPQP